MARRTKEIYLSLVVFGVSSGLLFGGTGDDHGNNAALSTAVLVPSTTAGFIEVGTDVDWFRFSAIAGTYYTFETILGTLPDSLLTLFGTDGVTQIAFDDDGGQGLASKIEWTAPANGTYYLEVGSFNATQTGTYSLIITSGSVQPWLTLSVAQASISENGGASQATVTRSSGTSGSLTVTLASNDTTEATVPSTVTIPDGTDSTTFTVTGVDDAVVDGTQVVTITASAAGHTSDSATVVVTDDDVNDDPVANDDSVSTLEDLLVLVDVLANDTDADDDLLSVSSFTQPPNGSVMINPDGTLTYTPATGFTGENSFTYTVDDGNGGTDTGTVTVTVIPFIDINIDIYPNRTPNRVYLSRNYTIYVAVLGGASFDVANMDPSSVLFGRTGTEAGPVRAPIIRDLNGDGFLDAMYGFRTFDCGFQLNDTNGWLTGFMADGTLIEGSDSVLVSP